MRNDDGERLPIFMVTQAQFDARILAKNLPNLTFRGKEGAVEMRNDLI